MNDPSRQASIEEFHTVLSDVSHGECTDIVKKFIVQSYVRGARYGSAELCPLEKVTSVFTKRRYRDAWDKALARKIATMADRRRLFVCWWTSREQLPRKRRALMSSDGGMATAKTHNHSMKIRGMVRPKGQRGSSWYRCMYRIRRLVGVRAAAAVVCLFL